MLTENKLTQDQKNHRLLSMPKTIVMKSIHDLIPYANNARIHSEEQIAKIASSILDFGFTNPVLIDSQHGIIAGHGRVLGAKKLGLDEVPVVILDHLTPEQKKAYIIADNKLAEQAGWDEELLALELNALRELDVDLEKIGFSAEELEELYSSLYEKENLSDDLIEEEIPDREEKPVTQLGQLWLLGKHKVLCGNACEKENFNILLGDQKAHMTFTDPPYNVDYHVLPTLQKGAKYRKREKQKGILNDNIDHNFLTFLELSSRHIVQYTQGACYIFMSASELPTLHKAFIEAGGYWSSYIIWVKNHFTIGFANYRRQYEIILYGWPKDSNHYWCGKRDQSDVWEIDKEPKSHLHPTMKPIALCERAISNSSKTGDIVLDCFAGSGSTLMACQRLNREARLIELDPKYVDVIIKRWQKATGMKAIDANTQKTFDSLLLEPS